MANIQRRVARGGVVSYRVRVRLKGHPLKSKTFPRLREAKAWAAAVEREAARSGPLPAEGWNRSVADAIDRFLHTHLPDLKPTTQRMRVIRLRWWRERIGELPLSLLSPAIVSEQIDALRAGAGPSRRRVSPATTNRYLAALRRVLSLASREWRWATFNAALIGQAPEGAHRERFLSREEADRLLVACRRSRSSVLEPLVVVALMTGARQAELMRLRWEDLDLGAQRATIQESKAGRRTVPLPTPAVAALRSIVRRLDSPAVFGGSWPVMFPRSAWERARSRADLAGVRFHDLRHTAASWLLMSGAGLKDVQHILGHRSIQTTLRYVHLAEDHSLAVAERMASAWAGGWFEDSAG
jgi:integrase